MRKWNWPRDKKATENFWQDGNQENFFVIEGVENIPIEKCPTNYWKRLGKEDKPIFHKIVGLNDKITFAEFKEKPTDKLSDPLPKELSGKTLIQYFQKNNIKSIKLENNNLVIEYSNKQEKETKEINNQELEQIKSLTEKIGKNELSLSDLEQKSNSSNSPNNSNKELYISLAVVGVILIGSVAWLLMRNNKKKRTELKNTNHFP